MKSRSRRKLQLISFIALAFAYVVFWIFSGNISDNRSLFNIQRVRTGTVYEQHPDETLVEMRWSCFDQVADYDKPFDRYEDDIKVRITWCHLGVVKESFGWAERLF